VTIANHVSGLGARVHREFVQASGEMSADDFFTFLGGFLRLAASRLVDGGVLAVFMDWRHIATLLEAGAVNGLELINLVVWSKTNAGMGSLYRSAHELLPLFKAGRSPHVNNVELGRHGRWRSNVWVYPGGSSLGSDARDRLADHPTPKPVRLIEDALYDVSNRGEIVLDPFLGSGSTLMAAERSGRRCYGCELDPVYVDVILRRWFAETGAQPVLAETGETFVEVEARRQRERSSAPVALSAPARLGCA
jgi:DNA modification methylase